MDISDINIDRSREAIGQFNACDSQNPLFTHLKLVQEGGQLYLKAVALTASERIARRLGYGSTDLAKIAEFLYVNRNTLFPEPYAHRYASDRLTRKLQAYQNTRQRMSNYPLANRQIGELLNYLLSFEEKLEKIISNQDAAAFGKLFKGQLPLSAIEGKGRCPHPVHPVGFEKILTFLQTISRRLPLSEREALFSGNSENTAPFHYFAKHYFQGAGNVFTDSAWWHVLAKLIICIPSTCFKENLGTNGQTVFPSAGSLLEEKLSREETSQNLDLFIKAVPAESLKYIFTYPLLRFIGIEKHQLMHPVIQSILQSIPAEDKPGFRIEALAALKSLINYAAFFNAEQPAVKAIHQSISSVINLFGPLESIDDVTEGKRGLFINILQYPSLAQGYYNKHPLDFTQRINALGGFAALPETVQEKVCFILPEKALSAFIAARIGEREKILKTPLSVYSAEEEKDFYSIFLSITALDVKDDFSSVVKTISFLLDHFSPFHFICLLGTTEYQSIVAAYLVCFLQFHTEMLLPRFSCHAFSKIETKYFHEEIKPLLLNTFISKVGHELSRFQIGYDTLIHASKVVVEEAMPEPQNGPKPPSPEDLLLVEAEVCLPGIESFLAKLLESENFSENTEFLKQCLERTQKLKALYKPLQTAPIASYKAPDEFCDSILFTIMRTPLTLPFSDSGANSIEKLERVDALIFKKRENRVLLDNGEVLYKNPFNRQEHPRTEFKVDKDLQIKIEEWKKARPYWEEYSDKHFI